MTIQIELTPEEEARLRERAAACDTAPEALAAELLRAELLPPLGPSARDTDLLPVRDEHGVFHPERLDAVLERCAELSAGLPYLPPEALTREALYQDHD
jgi:hypothetical protein